MRLIDADLFMQRIESYNTLDEKDKALYNFALNEIVCMPTVCDIDAIRQEIEQKYNDYKMRDDYEEAYGLEEALMIIDQYIRGDSE